MWNISLNNPVSKWAYARLSDGEKELPIWVGSGTSKLGDIPSQKKATKNSEVPFRRKVLQLPLNALVENLGTSCSAPRDAGGLPEFPPDRNSRATAQPQFRVASKAKVQLRSCALYHPVHNGRKRVLQHTRKDEYAPRKRAVHNHVRSLESFSGVCHPVLELQT
jgi:hypothetical protein